MWALLDIRQGRANREQFLIAVMVYVPLILVVSNQKNLYLFWIVLLVGSYVFLVFLYKRVRDFGGSIKSVSISLFLCLFLLLFPLQFGLKSTDSSLYARFFGFLYVLFFLGIVSISKLFIFLVNSESRSAANEQAHNTQVKKTRSKFSDYEHTGDSS
ncbi:MAG: hypothetical protein IPH06_10615 [Alphaproteobacteria bacterium]|jgi:hypothetical protein|nr:hypothetical protein [Alphaproteobacteria bacterium]QQS58436.1 MAG: hypothetical protein IPN28_06370 [Alphaproteobacteria bacterium]